MAVVALLLIGGWFAYPHLNEYWESRPDNGDYQSDGALLEKLVAAKLPTAPAEAALDWPQWRGPRRDGVSSETGLASRWPASGPDLIWKVKTGEGYSAPSIAAGRLFLLVQDGDHEAVVCWDADKGTEHWRHRYPAHFSNRESGVGPHASPTIDGDRVYTVGATGMLFCLAVGDGKVIWAHDLLNEFKVANQEYGVSFSPLIEGDLVITVPGGVGGNSIVAFDKKDGHLVWKTLNDRAGYSSPVAATIAGKRQIVMLTAEAVHGVSTEDGKPYWKYPWPLFKDCNVATPLVVGDYVFLSSGYSKGCALLEISTGGNGAMEARPVYEHNRMRNWFSCSVLYRDHLYGFDEAFLVCMEFRTGKVLWKKRGYGRGSLMAADGHLIIMGEHGQLVLAEANPERFVEQSSCKILNDKTWTTPVLANGKLYVRDEEQLLCLKVKAE